MNTKTTHSPGPWNIEYSDAGKPRRIVDAAGEHVAYAHPSRYADGEQDPEAEGNILLMAAAPDLLAFARRVMADHRAQLPSEARDLYDGGCGCPQCVQASAATAKAEGRE